MMMMMARIGFNLVNRKPFGTANEIQQLLSNGGGRAKAESSRAIRIS
jgi:hypothetical protein